MAGRAGQHGLARPRDRALAVGRERLEYGALARRAAAVSAGLGTAP